MNDRMILTPYFLDEYDPVIAALAGDDWHVVAPDLPDGDQPTRLSAIHRALAGEVRAAAVRAYGPALLEKMNGLRIPKFADGGLVGAAMSAPVGQSGRDLGRVDLNVGGETISLLADQQNFTDLVQRQKWKRGSTRKA